MTALTIRHELAFDPVTQDLIRDLLRAITRGAAPVAEPEPAGDDALARLARALEAERSVEALALRMGPALGAFYRRDQRASPAANRVSPSPLAVFPPGAFAVGKHTTSDLRKALVDTLDAGWTYDDLEKELGVNKERLYNLASKYRKDIQKPAQLQNVWSDERRETLRRLVDMEGRKLADIAEEWGFTRGAVKVQLYHARKAYALRPAPAELTPAELEPPPPAPPPAPTTVRTLDQHRAVVAAISPPPPPAPAELEPPPPPPAPRPPAAPPRQIRQDLAAEMAAFEAAKGVIRIPTAREFAAIGVPMSFPDEAAAIEWLTSHGHDVRKGPGQSVITLDGKRVARPSFPQRAAGIAREYGMKLIAERQNQGRAA